MKRAKLTASLLILATLLSVSMVSSVKADTYSATEKDPYAWPECRIYLVINTDTKKLEFKWDAPAWLILPFPNLKFVEVVWHVWDDKGFDVAGLSATPITQTVTFDYYHTYTWAYAEAYWFYVFMNVPWLAHAKIILYVGSSGGGGGGGGGCPILYVWNETAYVCEGLLDIHNPEGVDVVYQHTLVTTPERVNGAYLLRLVEHPQTHSYIDQVKLYAILKDKTVIKLPLIWAWHSEYGNVLPQLLFSDDWKTDTLGADLNNGTSQSIDLKFAALNPNMNIASFVFQIEGNNIISKV